VFGTQKAMDGGRIKAITIVSFFKKKDLLHRKSVRYTGLQNYEIIPLTNLP